MAATGTILAFQPQIIRYAERNIHSASQTPGQSCISSSNLIESVQSVSGRHVTALQFFSDPRVPTLITLQGDTTLLADSCTGTILGPGANRLRIFFNQVRDLHRWVALHRGQNEALLQIKDAANLGFSFLLVSGLILWIPRKWRSANFKAVLLFRRDLHGRAREWNLHNIAGIWLAIPLLLISVSGSIMAYPWANNLLYRAAGSAPPPKGEHEHQGEHEPQAAGEHEGRHEHHGQHMHQGDHEHQGGHEHQDTQQPVNDLSFLDPVIMKAKFQDPQWHSVSLRLPGAGERNVSLTIDEGPGGYPQQRGQLVISLQDAAIQRWEPFDKLSRGRQWRLYSRFLHTGEMFGVVGQSIAFLSVLAALTLVWTGFSLAIRRFIAWRKRTAKSAAKRVPLQMVSGD